MSTHENWPEIIAFTRKKLEEALKLVKDFEDDLPSACCDLVHRDLVELERQRSEPLRQADSIQADLIELKYELAFRSGLAPDGTSIFAEPYERELARLRGRAGADWLAFGVLNQHMIMLNRAGTPFPTQMRLFLNDVLAGDITAPAVPRLSGHELRDKIICALIKRLSSKFRLRPTRSDLSRRGEYSACDAVAEAFHKLGQRPQTYDGIKRIRLDGLRDKEPLMFGEDDELDTTLSG